MFSCVKTYEINSSHGLIQSRMMLWWIIHFLLTLLKGSCYAGMTESEAVIAKVW